ncbi:MAG: hypothetical protein NW207_09485 [Cytophagales bacterium]|nr:hypothetical protein [Cytophagales bacterium]
MKKNIYKLFFSCIRATELLEQDKKSLSLLNRIRLHIHLTICPPCRKHQDFSKKLDEKLSTILELKNTDNQLDKEFKENLLKKILDKMSG